MNKLRNECMETAYSPLNHVNHIEFEVTSRRSWGNYWILSNSCNDKNMIELSRELQKMARACITNANTIKAVA
jgi:hypothetical protein